MGLIIPDLKGGYNKFGGGYMSDGKGNATKIGGMYYADGKGNAIKIYSSGLPVGTILWSGSKAFATNDPFGGSDDFFNNNFLLNKEITLSNTISKCQNGIIVNFSKAACISSGGTYFNYSYSGNIHLPKSFSNGQIYIESGETIVSLIKKSDSIVYFHSTYEGDNSSTVDKFQSTYLCIDSITAY